ncbi:MAG: ArsR family transcriptional regulator [Methanomassiliicoccales archaeon]|nr:MAG: ArsR family transcriptional regulator [Methanomassiliicoccales archaeon]
MDPLEAARLITDEYSSKILLATFKKPRSVVELSSEYGIPIAACYRRLHTLERVGLVKCVEQTSTEMGKRRNLYQSQLEDAHIFLENGELNVRFSLTGGLTEEFGSAWSADSFRIEPAIGRNLPSWDASASNEKETPAESDDQLPHQGSKDSKEYANTSSGEQHLAEEAVRALERVVSVSREAIDEIRASTRKSTRDRRYSKTVLAETEKVADATKELASKTKRRFKGRGKK